MADNTVTFNGIDLESAVPGLKILSTDPGRPPARMLEFYPLARADRSVIVAAHYKERHVHAFASLSRDNKAGFEAGMRELEALMIGKNKLLVLNQAGEETEYTATREHISLEKHAGGYGSLDIDFNCSNPFGYRVTPVTLYSYPALVGSDYSFAVDWLGNVPQQPVIEITINSVTLPGSTGAITLSNTETAQTMTVRSEYEAAEVLEIDIKNGTVTIDGDAVDWTGDLIEWGPGDSPIVYSDDFTDRNIAIDISYQVRNL